jgi:hypothetical protein
MKAQQQKLLAIMAMNDFHLIEPQQQIVWRASVVAWAS